LPALLAAELGIGQALGLALVVPNSDGLRVARRLDGGELQHLIVRGRCVLSVSPGTALPVRMSLPALLSAPKTAVRVGLAVDQDRHDDVVRRPHRPRSKDVLLPAGDVKTRLETILGVGACAASADGSFVAAG
jgi:electron transfer flavoprotein alpha/beta subunit